MIDEVPPVSVSACNNALGRALKELQKFKHFVSSAMSEKLDDQSIGKYEDNAIGEEDGEFMEILTEEGMYDAIDEQFSDDDEEEGDQEDKEDQEDKKEVSEGEVKLVQQRKSKKPPGYELVCEILKRCSYFLASVHLESQLVVIDTMIAAFRRLANHRSILLPNVHTTWPMVMTRFKEQCKLLELTSSPYFQFEKKGLDKRQKTSDSSLLFRGGGVEEKRGINSFLLREVAPHPPSSSTTISLSSSSSYLRQDDVHMVSRQRILLLPGLLDLFSLLSYLCGSFLSLKFEEDIWPSFMKIVRVMSADAILESVSSSSSSSSSSLSSRFNLNTKLKLSSLRFMLRLCKMSSVVNSYLKHVIPQLAWMCIPFLHSSQHVEVNLEAKRVLAALCRLDQPFVRGLLFALGDLCNRSIEPSLGCSQSIWASIITEPRIIRVHTIEGPFYGSDSSSSSKNLRENFAEDSVSCVPMCDKLLEIYCTDKQDGLGKLVVEIYMEDVKRGVSSVVKR